MSFRGFIWVINLFMIRDALFTHVYTHELGWERIRKTLLLSLWDGLFSLALFEISSCKAFEMIWFKFLEKSFSNPLKYTFQVAFGILSCLRMWLFYPLVFGTIYVCMTCPHVYRGHSIGAVSKICPHMPIVSACVVTKICVHMCTHVLCTRAVARICPYMHRYILHMRLLGLLRAHVDLFFMCSCQDSSLPPCSFCVQRVG